MSQAAEVEQRTTHPITVTVNGTPRSADVEPRLLLVHFLRETLSLTGTHIGCDTTSCGACTVLVDGTPVKSCTYLAVQADGRAVTTVEGLGAVGSLHALQDVSPHDDALASAWYRTKVLPVLVRRVLDELKESA